MEVGTCCNVHLQKPIIYFAFNYLMVLIATEWWVTLGHHHHENTKKVTLTYAENYCYFTCKSSRKEDYLYPANPNSLSLTI